ncbi:MAG: C1 family peptidase [Deltaproteobacteria bacterium]|nr:C1 family peptidase [Deltaproteobacteria bacterium]
MNADASSTSGPAPSEATTSQTGPEAVTAIGEAVTVEGRPALKLPDGSTVLLMPREEMLWYQDRFAPVAEVAPGGPAREQLPASVDLSGFQTPVKDQGGRDTCIDFATVAAIEAAYKRTHGVTLDLSEQWLNHIQKMDTLDSWDTVVDVNGDHRPKPPSQMENTVGTWGGGSVVYNLRLLSSGKLALPEESAMPYVSSRSLQMTASWNPAIAYTSPQRVADDVNLSRVPATFNIPWALTTTMFPPNAQATARYASTQALFASGTQLASLDWYKRQVASGHEIAFSVGLDDDAKWTNDVWEPGKTFWAGHAMLIIGYDDAKQAFRVKNSWGTGFADDGYVWFSYQWVTERKIYEAAVIGAVAPPNAAPPPEQLFLGRYHLDHDGWQGLLDIYHAPDSAVFAFKSGAADHRLGTYYGPDNQARRVNGVINGRHIDFYIDWGNTGARGYGELSGLHFSGFLADDNETVAGTVHDNRDGETYGFYGNKARYLVGEAVTTGVSFASYVGEWQVYGKDIPSGSFTVRAVASETGLVTGNEWGGGALVATVSRANPRSFHFQLQGQSYEGYLFGGETGVMAGTVGGGSASFVAVRRGFGKPQVSIISPFANISRGSLFQLVGEARGDNGSGFIVDLPCHWTIDGNVLGSTACSQMSSFASNGAHTIQLSATDVGNATASTLLTVNVVDPPPVPLVTTIAIDGNLLLAGPEATQNPVYDPYLKMGTWGSMATLNLIGTASGGAEPLQYRWTWHFTDKDGCPEIDVGFGGAPSWTPVYDKGACIDYGHGDLSLHVTDANGQTASRSVRVRFVAPPF